MDKLWVVWKVVEDWSGEEDTIVAFLSQDATMCEVVAEELVGQGWFAWAAPVIDQLPIH